MEKVLIAGAHGTTGKEIVRLLKDHPQFEPIAMVRKKEQQAVFDLQNTKTVLADLEGDLTEAVKGIDRVIFAAGSGGKNTIAVDQNGAINLIDSSKAAGVKKFVMLSAMGTEKPEAMPELEAYFHAKKRLNQSGEISRKDVAQVLVDSLPSTILQNKEVEILAGETAIPLALKGIQ